MSSITYITSTNLTVLQFEALRAWGDAGKPIWGTCAGLVVLADRVDGQKKVHLHLLLIL